VLGAVRQHGRAHGYQVRNDLEYWGAHEWSNAKPGSIYHALKALLVVFFPLAVRRFARLSR
jgi:DNA-binding PadR family transcriptional regulator